MSSFSLSKLHNASRPEFEDGQHLLPDAQSKTATSLLVPGQMRSIFVDTCIFCEAVGRLIEWQCFSIKLEPQSDEVNKLNSWNLCTIDEEFKYEGTVSRLSADSIPFNLQAYSL